MDKSRDEFVVDNMKLVYGVLHRYYPNWVTDEDIVQVGTIGLINAVDTYDSTKGEFSSYAYACILNEIRGEFKRMGRRIKPISLSKVVHVNEFNDEEMTLEDVIPGDTDVSYVNEEDLLKLLDERELKIYKLLKLGYRQDIMAKMLGLKASTLRMSVRRIRKKSKAALL